MTYNSLRAICCPPNLSTNESACRMNAIPTGPQELEPWIIVSGDEQVAVWRIQDNQQDSQRDALALFSDRDYAQSYAQNHCCEPWRVVQCSDTHLIRLLADSFQQGIVLATLNPGETTTSQVFVLRDVLKAAKAQLERQRTKLAQPRSLT
jgi:hypothetical protein